MEGAVPNLSPTYTESVPPRLRQTYMRTSSSWHTQRMQTIQMESIKCTGLRLFNCLSRNLGDLTGVKRRLDKFLGDIPDESPVPHGLSSRGASTNSEIDELQYKNRKGVEMVGPQTGCGKAPKSMTSKINTVKPR